MNFPFSKTAGRQNVTRELSDDVLQTAEQAVESTRDLAHDAIRRADNKARDLRASLDPAIDHLAQKAQDLAQRSKGLAMDTSARAQRRLTQYADVTSKYVAEQPVKSVLIAAAAGAVIAALLVSHGSHREP